MTTGKCKPDRVWSLNPEHEIVFKQTWAVMLKNFGYDLDHLSYDDIEKPENFVASKSKNALPKISETSVLGSTPKPSDKTVATFHALNGKSDMTQGVHDKSVKSPNKHPFHVLSKFNHIDMHQYFWSSLRNDSPDGNLLRFVRARKFKLHAIAEMCAKCLEWKAGPHKIDEWVLEGDSSIYFEKSHVEIIGAFEMEKAYFRGRDREGGPICVIRVKKHFGHDCPEKDFERFICLIIEWFRFALKDYELGVDGANILFDMSGFSLKNADLKAVAFLAKAFEANYPECLSAIWIHKAPWIFNAVWKIIKAWLDPVVASKIHFTKTPADLEKFVEKKYIPKDLGGDDDYAPKYVVPTKENSSKLPKDDKYEKLMAQREQLCLAFLESTLSWINAKSVEESTKLLDIKIQLGAELAKNYLKLDPYVRNRGTFDRDGSLGTFSF